MALLVVLDTNFLTIPAQFGVDIFSETEALLEQRVRFLVLESVVNEIKSQISSSSRRRASIFRVAQDLLRRCEIVHMAPTLAHLSVDEQLLEYAAATGALLATNDQELRERARAKGIPVLTLRDRSRLFLDGNV